MAELQAHAQARGTEYSPQVFGVAAQLEDRGCVSGSLTEPAEKLLDDPNLVTVGGAGELLAVACEPTLAAGKHFGLQLRSVTGTPQAVVGDESRTYYTNLESGEAAAAGALISEVGLAELHEQAAALGAKQMGAKPADVPEAGEESLAALRAAVGDVTFETNGTTYV